MSTATLVNRSSTLLRRSVAVALGMALLGASSVAGAQTAKEVELEKRVAELEKMVQQLVAEKQAAPAPAAAPVAAAPAKPDPKAIQAGAILPNAAPGTSFVMTGFAKVDGMWTDTPDGEMADNVNGRFYYVPGAIPVNGLDEGVDFNAHAKQSRLNIGTDTVLASGDKVSTRFEFDFYGSSSGSQAVSNAYQPMVRHAYVQWREWLVGQTWTNFMDAGLLPETTDYIGPTDGTLFVRQAQVRYTKGGLSLSLENPETTFTNYSTGASGSSDDNSFPDMTARYQWKGAWGLFEVAGLARELKYETTGTGAIDASAWSMAASVSGKYMIGKDDIRFSVSGGNLGRYAALNFTNDAVLAADGDFESIDGVIGWVGYRHLFSDKLRTNMFFAMGDYDNPDQYTGDPTKISKSSQSWAINLFYSPLPKLDIGAEWRSGTRELENGDDGSLNRLQLTTKYSF